MTAGAAPAKRPAWPCDGLIAPAAGTRDAALRLSTGSYQKVEFATRWNRAWRGFSAVGALYRTGPTVLGTISRLSR